MRPTIGVITNPNSKKNWRHRGRTRNLRRVLGRHGHLRETRSLDELPQAVDDLIDSGCDYWVCDGGDGTLNWIVNTGRERLAARNDGRPMPVIVPTNGGTVDFVARKARLRGDAETILAQLVDALDRGHAPATIEVDTCLHRGEEVDDDGALKPFERLGLASAVGGVARNFFDHFYQLPKTRGAGAIAGVIGAAAGGAILQSLAPGVQRLFSDRARAFAEEFYKPTRARVEVDGKELASDCFMSLQVGAIDINLAGVVRCFRRAASGGVLHFQAIATTPFGVLVNVPSIVLGTPIVGRDVFDGEAKTVTITPADGGAVDPVIDGEPFTGLRWLELSLGPRLRIPLLRH